jgi:hypothetical protein
VVFERFAAQRKQRMEASLFDELKAGLLGREG